jgi:hypothetical protein
MSDAQNSCRPGAALEIPGYRLLEKIGEGGMGEVHRATQLSLQRTVAIKFLHQLAGEDDGLGGLQREARLSGKLTHPCIVTTYDCGQFEGHHYLIMEYVEGTTLRLRMKPGQPMPIDQAASILDSAARALIYIHQQGILHLDLKPENVLCTPSGAVKITDFGLASAQAYSRSVPEAQRYQGTMDYCSPEQRHGLPIDQSSDVFALATMAYELLTGELPGRVYLPATALNPRLPRAANQVLRRGLARDPAERYPTVEEFRHALASALSGFRWRTMLWPSLAGAAALILIMLPVLWMEAERRRHAHAAGQAVLDTFVRPAPFPGQDEILYPSNRTGTTGIFLLHPDGRSPCNLTQGAGRCIFPACSPDGRTIAFTSDRDGHSEIFVMDASGDNVRQLTRNNGDNRAPAWSPDGRRIAFISERDARWVLAVMDMDGSHEVCLTEPGAIDADPAWSPDGRRIAFARMGEGGFRLAVMDADGKNVRLLSQKDNRLGYVYPAWSPSGKQIAYGDMVGSSVEIFVCASDGSSPRQLTDLGGLNGLPAWSRDGKWIVFHHSGNGEEIGSLFIMDADGHDVRTIFEAAGPREGGRAAWKPRLPE